MFCALLIDVDCADTVVVNDAMVLSCVVFADCSVVIEDWRETMRTSDASTQEEPFQRLIWLLLAVSIQRSPTAFAVGAVPWLNVVAFALAVACAAFAADCAEFAVFCAVVIEVPCDDTVVCSVEIADDWLAVVVCSVVMLAVLPFTVLVSELTVLEIAVSCDARVEASLLIAAVSVKLFVLTVEVSVVTVLEMAESALARVLSSAVMRAMAAATPVVGLLTVDSRVVAREASADV